MTEDYDSQITLKRILKRIIPVLCLFVVVVMVAVMCFSRWILDYPERHNSPEFMEAMRKKRATLELDKEELERKKIKKLTEQVE